MALAPGTRLGHYDVSADLPAKLENLLRRCLEKEPRECVRDIGDVRLAMMGAFETAPRGAVETGAASPLRPWQGAVPAVAAALLIASIAGITVWSRTRPVPPAPVPPARVTVNASRTFPLFPERGTLYVGAPAGVAVLELREGTFEFVDNYENRRTGRQRLFPSETVLGGKRVPHA